jgi:hypothetical protein
MLTVRYTYKLTGINTVSCYLKDRRLTGNGSITTLPRQRTCDATMEELLETVLRSMRFVP